MVMFLFLVVALAVVVAAVTLAVVGGGESAPLPEAAPERLRDQLPLDRPVGQADVESLRFPLAARGYRMADVDDALGRLGAELAERDARIADLESALAGARAAAHTAHPRYDTPAQPRYDTPTRPRFDKPAHPEDHQ
ncbi:DivIVA domain-containing protein [Streptomyces sp. NPDC001984]|uniref:DivIVA domain-containing protein n=1 Tax=Streptomyces sp. NPDC002619 TaxID=3364655 RepID=UPI0036C5A262